MTSDDSNTSYCNVGKSISGKATKSETTAAWNNYVPILYQLTSLYWSCTYCFNCFPLIKIRAIFQCDCAGVSSTIWKHMEHCWAEATTWMNYECVQPSSQPLEIGHCPKDALMHKWWDYPFGPQKAFWHFLHQLCSKIEHWASCKNHSYEQICS